jgi:hypothetical protein
MQADLFPAHTAGAGARFVDPAEDAPGMVAGGVEVSVYVSRSVEDADHDFDLANTDVYETCSRHEAEAYATDFESTATGPPETLHPPRQAAMTARAVIDEYGFTFPTGSGPDVTWVARISIVRGRALIRVLVATFARPMPGQLDSVATVVARRAEASFG